MLNCCLCKDNEATHFVDLDRGGILRQYICQPCRSRVKKHCTPLGAARTFIPGQIAPDVMCWMCNREKAGRGITIGDAPVCGKCFHYAAEHPGMYAKREAEKAETKTYTTGLCPACESNHRDRFMNLTTLYGRPIVQFHEIVCELEERTGLGGDSTLKAMLDRTVAAKDARIRELEAEVAEMNRQLELERTMRRGSASRMLHLLDRAKAEIAVKDWECAAEKKP